MNLIGTALEDPALRENVNNILSAYSTFDKMTLIIKQDMLYDDLSNVLGDRASLALVNFLSSTGQYTSELVQFIQNEDQKRIVQQLGAKFNPIFSGFYTGYPNDWLRFRIRTSIDLDSTTPVSEMYLIKSNGEIISLGVPWPNLFALLAYVMDHMNISLDRFQVLEELRSSTVDNCESIRDSINSIIRKLNSAQKTS